ncbi:hypothetical protein Tco_1084828 [Tanacetum coccineum]
MKCWEELIRENVSGLGGHRDHLSASIAHMLYCIVAEEQYNLAYFFIKLIECVRATLNANLPYGMFLTVLDSSFPTRQINITSLILSKAFTMVVDAYMFVSAVLVYLLYGSAGVRVITAAGGRSYKENSRFKRKVATDLEAVMMISRGLGKDMF